MLQPDDSVIRVLRTLKNIDAICSLLDRLRPPAENPAVAGRLASYAGLKRIGSLAKPWTNSVRRRSAFSMSTS